MQYRILFYDLAIMHAINAWPIGIRSKFRQIVGLLETYGSNAIVMPHVKAIGGGIYEIRARGKEGIARAMFCISEDKEVIILHEFIKKTQRLPFKELNITKKRLREIQNEKKTNIKRL